MATTDMTCQTGRMEACQSIFLDDTLPLVAKVDFVETILRMYPEDSPSISFCLLQILLRCGSSSRTSALCAIRLGLSIVTQALGRPRTESPALFCLQVIANNAPEELTQAVPLELFIRHTADANPANAHLLQNLILHLCSYYEDLYTDEASWAWLPDLCQEFSIDHVLRFAGPLTESDPNQGPVTEPSVFVKTLVPLLLDQKTRPYRQWSGSHRGFRVLVNLAMGIAGDPPLVALFVAFLEDIFSTALVGREELTQPGGIADHVICMTVNLIGEDVFRELLSPQKFVSMVCYFVVRSARDELLGVFVKNRQHLLMLLNNAGTQSEYAEGLATPDILPYLFELLLARNDVDKRPHAVVAARTVGNILEHLATIRNKTHWVVFQSVAGACGLSLVMQKRVFLSVVLMSPLHVDFVRRQKTAQIMQHMTSVSPPPMSEDSTESVCAVCLDGNVEMEWCCLPCKHTFHRTCLTNALLRKLSCPLCRADVQR